MRKESCSIFVPSPSLHTTVATVAVCMYVCVLSYTRWQGRKEKVGESEMVRKENADDVMNNTARVRRLGRYSVGDGGKAGRGKDSEQLRGQELKMTMTNSE